MNEENKVGVWSVLFAVIALVFLLVEEFLLVAISMIFLIIIYFGMRKGVEGDNDEEA